MKGYIGTKGTYRKEKYMGKEGKEREKIKESCLSILKVLVGFFVAVYWLAVGNIVVLAAPVSLESPSAVVYEQASEGSNAVGNLIQDSTFDYQGDVTAEDGSTWHMVTMANGVSGYIRGDLALSPVENGEAGTGAEAEGGEEGTDPETENGEAGADAGAENGEAGAGIGTENGEAGANVGTEQGEAPAGDAGEDGEASAEDGNTAEEDANGGQAGEGDALPENLTQPVHNVENNRQKTYVSSALGTKIKQAESMLEPKGISESSANAGFFGRLDKTLIFSGLVLICSFLMGTSFFKKLRRAYVQSGETGGNILDGAVHRYDKRNMRRKRKSRRKKNKKKKQQVKREYEKTHKTPGGKRSGYMQDKKE